MLLVLLIALEMAMFQGAWEIVVVPSITLTSLALNLGLFFLLVRPRSLETRIIGMIWGGVVASFGVVGYFWLGHSRFDMLGPLGGLIADASESWGESLPDQQGLTVSILRFITAHMIVIEFALLDLVGVAFIWAGGWLQNCLHGRRARARASRCAGLPPLDDRAPSPV